MSNDLGVAVDTYIGTRNENSDNSRRITQFHSSNARNETLTSVEKDGELRITGNTYIIGDLRVKEIDILKTIADLQSQLIKMEEKITMMYYSPGMPGYFESKNDFEINSKEINSID